MKGVDLTKILTTIKSKKSVSAIEIIEIRSTQQYKSYQLKLQVDVSNFEFWKTRTFWPHGTVVFLWRGEADYAPQQFYHKRIQVSNFKKSVTAETLIRTFRSIFHDVSFEEAVCERIYDGKAVLAVKLQVGEFRRFSEAGLRYSDWPRNVKVRFLRRNFIAKRRNGWVEAEPTLEIVRREFEVADRDDAVEINLPVANSASSSELAEVETTSIGVQTEMVITKQAEIAVQVGINSVTSTKTIEVLTTTPLKSVDAAVATETDLKTVPAKTNVLKTGERVEVIREPVWTIVSDRRCKFCGAEIDPRIYTAMMCSACARPEIDKNVLLFGNKITFFFVI